MLSRASEQRMFVTGNESPILRSGDQDFDRALAQTLGILSDRFEVLPGFAYYNDATSPNAYASSTVRLNGADGTVLFGQRLLRDLMAGNDHPELAVAAVCAHEFGHILQFKHGLTERVNAGQPNVRRSELQADYFAGYFAGLRKLERPSFPAAVFAQAQWAAGDTQFSSPQHHGTQDERASAVIQGFYASYRDRRSLSDAIAHSTAYVLAL